MYTNTYLHYLLPVVHNYIYGYFKDDSRVLERGKDAFFRPIKYIQSLKILQVTITPEDATEYGKKQAEAHIQNIYTCTERYDDDIIQNLTSFMGVLGKHNPFQEDDFLLMSAQDWDDISYCIGIVPEDIRVQYIDSDTIFAAYFEGFKQRFHELNTHQKLKVYLVIES